MLADFLHWMGLGLCHQLPERSFAAAGVQAPVCARDTGIYIGFTVALLLIAIMHRPARPRGFPRARVWMAMGLFIAFMAWDGVTSYAGLRATTNEMRLITGLGVGFAVAAVLVPMLNDEVWKFADAGRVLDPVWRFALWLAALPVAYAATLWLGPKLGVAFPVLIALCILFTLTAINLVIVSMLPVFDRRAERLRDLVVPVAIALLVSFAEIALAGQLRLLLDRLAGLAG